jgi:hypothetical protein
MSGCDKSISAMLTHGPVDKLPETRVYGLFRGFGDFSHGSTTKKKVDGKEVTFSTSVKKDEEDGKHKFSWSLQGTK